MEALHCPVAARRLKIRVRHHQQVLPIGHCWSFQGLTALPGHQADSYGQAGETGEEAVGAVTRRYTLTPKGVR
jgi:hypothetical protein